MTYVASHVDESTWPDVPLGSLVTFHSGGTPSKGNPAFWRGSIPWVSAKDMKSFRLSDTQDHITAEGAANGTRVVPRGSVLLLTRGMTLLNSVPVCLLDRDMAFNQDVKALRPSSRILPDYLPYLVLGNAARLKNMVDLAGHGTGRLNSEELKALNVRVPPMGDQGAIAHILGALDDKIELNRRMNETLEAMARTLFKSWFVDFEPVRAKMEGRDTNVPQHVADLFPDTFDHEHKPCGWSLGTLAELAHVDPESWSNRNVPEQVEYVDLANTKWGTIEATQSFLWQDAPSRAKRVLRPGDTIIGTVRPGNGSFAYIGISGLTGSTGFAVLRPHQPCDRAFVFLAATAPENIERLAHLADGAAYPSVRPQTVGATQAVVPDHTLMSVFSDLASPVLFRVENNKEQNRTLSRIRDLLLPKLISGELRVPDAERIVEDVA